MDLTSQAQSNTVELPDVTFRQLRVIVATMQAQARDQAERDRIGRGLETILTADLRQTGEVGVYLVQSSRVAGVYYKATSWSCCCPDRQRTGKPCRHCYAIIILSAARGAVRYAQALETAQQEAWRVDYETRKAERQAAQQGGVA
jgi:hypothetical protein